MKRAITIITLLVSSVNLCAQTKNPVTTVVKEIVPKQQTNLVAAVEAMPADKFGYQPTPQQMSFAHLVLQMTESNYARCGRASDMPQRKHDELKDADGKDKLLAALKSSSDFSNTALAKGG